MSEELAALSRPVETPQHRTHSASRTAQKRRFGRRIALSAIWLVCGAFFYWTATSAAGSITFGTTQSDYYNQLTNGFLHGELSIPTPAPPGLVHLADPYDPYQNAPYQAEFHDLSLYHGHLYLEWGPTPVLTLFMPWRLLHVGDMTQNLAVLIYVSVGLAFVLAALDAAVEALLAAAPNWKVILAGLVLGFGSVGAYLLRRPEVYEIAVSAGYCFVAIGLYFFASGGLGRVRRVRLALGSLAFGLAAGARFNLLLLGILPLALFLGWILRGGLRSWRDRISLAAVVIGPFALVALGLLLYNQLRFGSPLQIGAAYQLAGRDPTKTPFEELGYIAPSLYYNVVAPVRLTLAFPFIALPPPPLYPGVTPATFEPEILGGILTASPFIWLLAALPARRRDGDRRLFWSATALVVTAVAVLVLLAYGVPGATERYEADFATLFLFAAALVFLAWTPRRRWRRALLAIFSTLLAVATVLVGIAISVTGPDDELMTENPTTYHQLQQDFSFFPTFVTSVVGHADVVRVINPLASYPYNLGDYGTYQPDQFFSLYLPAEEVDVVAPHAGRYLFSARLSRANTAPRGSIHVNYVIGGTTVTFTLRDGVSDVVLPLTSGLNRIELSTTTFHPQAPGAFPEIVNVTDFGVRNAPKNAAVGVLVSPPAAKRGT